MMYHQKYISHLKWKTTINSTLLIPPSRTISNSTQTSVHRKYITITCKIAKDSCHPVEHEQAGIGYLIKRMDHYCTQEFEEYKEPQSTQNTVHNNQCQNEISNAIQRKIRTNTLRTEAFKLFKCAFPGSKQLKSTFVLCFFKNL